MAGHVLYANVYSLEDAHHIFVHCPHFSNLRDEYSKSLLSNTERLMSDSNLPPPLLSHLQRTTVHLFQDNSSWPLHSSSRFYLGLLPPHSPTHNILPIPHHPVTTTPYSPRSLLSYLRNSLGSAHWGTCRSRLPLLDSETFLPAC
jgi:hypothetical protein